MIFEQNNFQHLANIDVSVIWENNTSNLLFNFM